MEQESTRGLNLMRGTVPEQRASARSLFHLSGSMQVAHDPKASHVAFTRDLSTSGVFFYSDFEPPMSEDISLTLVTPYGGCLLLQGRVVRVEKHKPGAAVGIALALTSHLFAS